MVDKVGPVLRVDTVINQPDAFRVRKRVSRGQRPGDRVRAHEKGTLGAR